MDGRGLVAALAVSVLVALGAPAAAFAAPAAPVVPCPTEKLSPPPKRPPKPKAPALDPSHAQVGGEALATTGLAVPDGATTPPKLTASTWLVADLDTGQVLGACGAHGYETPASVQKVLLAATMIPKLDPKQVVQVIREDLEIDRGSSAVGLIEGGKYSIETLWYGLLFDSGNDAANVLARIGGGKEGRAGGVAAMNAEARRLGALQTHAVTPSGLDGPGQFTSAYDLVLIARAAFALPDFRRYVATRTAKIPPQPPKDPRGFQIQNDNGLLEKYPGALGGKSGFTTLARHSFVGAAKRGNRTLVAAVLGAEARPIRASEQTGKLLDWGFALPAGASVGRLVEPGETDPKPSPIPDSQAAAGEGAAPAAERLSASSPAAVIGLAVAVAAVVLVMLLAATRRRAVVRTRRAALAERRAMSGRGSPPARRVPRDGGRGLRDDGRRLAADARGSARDGDGRGLRGDGRGGVRGDGDDWLADGQPAGGGRRPHDGRRMAGRGEVSDGLYRPADPRPFAPPGPRPTSVDRYPPAERRPPAQRRPADDVPAPEARYAPGDSRYAQRDRRARGPAAPDTYRRPKPDERWP